MSTYYVEVPFSQRQRVALKVLTTLLQNNESSGPLYSIRDRMNLVESYTDAFMKMFPFPADDEYDDMEDYDDC